MIKDILQKGWYYTIEVEPGIYSRGRNHPSIALTRALLQDIKFAGTRCLDIGTQEAVVPVLMKRAGAKSVTAYDRWQLEERINLVKNAYGVDFDYISGIQLDELRGVLNRYFDIVIFSGVLYHLINPLGLLSIARSFCREGGLFLIETAALQDQGMALHFNAGGKLFGQSANYFLPTTNCLDYFLRMLRLKPIKALHLGGHSAGTVPRVAVLCRAIADPVPFGTEKDDWIDSKQFSRDLENEYAIRWDDLASNQPQIPVACEESTNLVTCGLYSEILESKPCQPLPQEVVLSLNSTV